MINIWVIIIKNLPNSAFKTIKHVMIFVSILIWSGYFRARTVPKINSSLKIEIETSAIQSCVIKAPGVRVILIRKLIRMNWIKDGWKMPTSTTLFMYMNFIAIRNWVACSNNRKLITYYCFISVGLGRVCFYVFCCFILSNY